MNEEIKAQWIAALRSGEYEQGRRRLSEDGKFCCLGVLCELAHKAGGIVIKDSSLQPVCYDDDESILPESVQEWAGLTEANPGVTVGEDEEYSLAHLNDGGEAADETYLDPYSFTQIADLIETQL